METILHYKLWFNIKKQMQYSNGNTYFIQNPDPWTTNVKTYFSYVNTTNVPTR